MLQLSYLREHKKNAIKGLKKRHFDAETAVNKVLTLDKKRRELQTELDSVKAEANAISKQIGQLFKSGKTKEANGLKEQSFQLKETAKDIETSLNETAEKLQELLYTIPNVPHKIVPEGCDETDNEEIFRHGEIPKLDTNALPHWELAKKHDIIDFDLGAKITGSGFPVYKGKGAKLQRALIAYFLDKNIAAGYSEYQLPLMVNEASGVGSGQLPDKEGQMYYIANDDLYLIPTSEVPAANIFRDTILNESDFPLKLTAYTPCFRREAGSYGAHVRGLNRLHQFDKVELFRIEHPEQSYRALNDMVEHVKLILNELKLPYRILTLCAGDLGFTSALTYDFELFSAAQNRWLEISSVSNLETFQANRLKLRFKTATGNNELAHTLNGSALALPRVLAGILENYQTKNGIKIPDVLVPYTGFSDI